MANTRLEIPLEQVPNQTFNIVLSGQSVTLEVMQLGSCIYVNMYLDATELFAGQRAVQGAYVNRYPSDFVGYLFWWNDEGVDPSSYTEFGVTSHLYYCNYDVANYAYENWVVENQDSLNEQFN